MKTEITTCQICGREIKAKGGVIAHHGYTRPGDGWQTASCFGARYQPYEQGCDAIAAAIDSVNLYIETTTKALTEILACPPEVVSVWNNFHKTTQKFQRPENFDFPRWNGSFADKYACAYARKIDQLKSGIKAAEKQVVFLTERGRNWSKQFED